MAGYLLSLLLLHAHCLPLPKALHLYLKVGVRHCSFRVVDQVPLIVFLAPLLLQEAKLHRYPPLFLMVVLIFVLHPHLAGNFLQARPTLLPRLLSTDSQPRYF